MIERYGQADLSPIMKPGFLPETESEMDELQNKLCDSNFRYTDESSRQTLTIETQKAYIDEELRTLREYESNPGRPIDDGRRKFIADSQAFLEAEKRVLDLMSIVSPPLHTPAGVPGHIPNAPNLPNGPQNAPPVAPGKAESLGRGLIAKSTTGQRFGLA